MDVHTTNFTLCCYAMNSEREFATVQNTATLSRWSHCRKNFSSFFRDCGSELVLGQIPAVCSFAHMLCHQIENFCGHFGVIP